ncbi:tail fiber domain-containing protein [Sulfurimonas sp.]|uniref:tail fiber domain-containing protein n=1 Tax=Sulfurimonas sp. TaxID=2022749 RepID=UPI003566FA3F
MGGGKGGSTSVQRPLTQNELDLIDTNKDAINSVIDIAGRQQDLSEQNQMDWNNTYRQMETGGVSTNASRENGFSNDNILTRDAYEQAQRDYNNTRTANERQLKLLQNKYDKAIGNYDKSKTTTQSNPNYNFELLNKGQNNDPLATDANFEFRNGIMVRRNSNLFNNNSSKDNTVTYNEKYMHQANKYQKEIDALKKKMNGNKTSWENKQIYNADPNSNLREAMLQANEQLGTVDQGVYDRQKANLFNGLDSNYTQAENNLTSTLAKRGIANSGIAAKSYTDLAGQKAGAMAQANNQAYNQAVQSGDAYRQQRVANLTGYTQLGRGMSGTAQNYLGQASQSYSNAASGAGSMFSGIGGLNNQYNSSMWNADAQAASGKGAMGGSLVGAGATLGAASIMGPAAAASDARLKSNIQKVSEYNGFNIYVWTWNDKAKQIGVANIPNIGVIAQEVKDVMPEAVIMADDGYYRVNYSMVLGV